MDLLRKRKRCPAHRDDEQEAVDEEKGKERKTENTELDHHDQDDGKDAEEFALTIIHSGVTDLSLVGLQVGAISPFFFFFSFSLVSSREFESQSDE